MAKAERVLLKPPAAWEAYDYYLQGTRAYWLGLHRKRGRLDRRSATSS